MNEQEISNSPMKVNVQVLRAAGLWPLRDTRHGVLYISFVQGIIVTIVIMSFFSAHYTWKDYDTFMFSLCMLFTAWISFIKRVMMLWNRPEFYKLAMLLGKLILSQKNHCQYNEELATIFEKSCKTSRRLTIHLTSYVLVLGVYWVIDPLLSTTQIENFPILQLAVKPTTNRLLYFVVYLTQALGIGYWILGTYGIDCFFVSVMIHVAGQLKILSKRISDLKFTHTQLKNLNTSDGDVINAHQTFLKELNLCIETHQHILGFAKYLEDVMSSFVLVQFSFVFTACIALYQMTQTSDYGAFLKWAGFLPTQLAQMAVYCWYADEAVDQGEAVAMAAYHCQWVDASQPFKRSMIIFMCRAQRPLKITVGGISQIDRSTLVSIIQASYSYYTVLVNFKQPDMK